MYRKILVPLDGSKLSESVLPHARALSEQDDAEIVLLRVPDYPVYDYSLTDPALLDMIHKQVNANSQQYLENAAAELRQAGRRVSYELAEGSVADAIVDCAARIHADLIAMSTHGRSGLARWLIGSVADMVVRAAPIPVLLVRPSVDE